MNPSPGVLAEPKPVLRCVGVVAAPALRWRACRAEARRPGVGGSTLGSQLENIFEQRADKVAFIKGADEVPFADVARAIDIMRGAGIGHIGLMPRT